MNRIQGLYTDKHEGICIQHDPHHKGIFSIRMYEEKVDDFSICTHESGATLKTRELILDVDTIRFIGIRPLSLSNQALVVDPYGKLHFQSVVDNTYVIIGVTSLLVYYFING